MQILVQFRIRRSCKQVEPGITMQILEQFRIRLSCKQVEPCKFWYSSEFVFRVNGWNHANYGTIANSV